MLECNCTGQIYAYRTVTEIYEWKDNDWSFCEDDEINETVYKCEQCDKTYTTEECEKLASQQDS